MLKYTKKKRLKKECYELFDFYKKSGDWDKSILYAKRYLKLK